LNREGAKDAKEIRRNEKRNKSSSYFLSPPLFAPFAPSRFNFPRSFLMDVYEVFRQEREGEPMRHAGNVLAPDRELATHYAREFYSRRQESIRLWVVPRAAIEQVDDPDLLQPPLDRSFKKPAGYVIKDKLDAARVRGGVP
jgi:ring-1,2-phenylacetyl-CoA epoxidase subunit PaaB